MKRFVFIGFDAADYRMVEQLAAEGSMPAFRRLMDSSARAITRSPFAFFVGAQWPSFYTGLDTAGHGRYCYRQLIPGTYEDRQFEAKGVDGSPFWDVLGAQGKRLAVIDVPKTVVSNKFPGIHVVDWATHDTELIGMGTSPTELQDEIITRYGEGRERDCNRVPRTAEGFATFRRNLLDRLATKERFVIDRIDQGDWDALVAVFADTHCAGHQLWHFHDSQHDRFDGTLVEEMGDPFRELYRAIDATLGRILERIPPDCIAMVFASHGIGRHWDGLHLMDDVLARLDNVLPHGGAPRASKLKAELARRARMIRPYRFRKYFPEPLSPRAFQKVFSIPNNEVYLGLRVNLDGREPLGRIRSAEFDSYCAALVEALSELRVGVDGPPAFTEIAMTRDRLTGPHLGDLPDIVARWSRDRPFDALLSPRIGEVRGRYKGVRTGDHQPDGLLLVSGGGIQPGERPACRVEDLAPTFAAMLGATFPQRDGSALPWVPC
ncbi:MAG: alkaline phosphatase family protein [Vicinamibacterales bacterium]